ncbi:hypothetical protein BLNAU_7336 [Blattamonas nauphoetae]|uniref:Uncharacterized protein n=1 Tax=Blattamonas nauphoetae TaxID=2049346 RepID=A0ABQ9Y1S8_9EUKA|nr:hypothetical protein BLNAU_7336 [Blattamonas nauphoetae]
MSHGKSYNTIRELREAIIKRRNDVQRLRIECNDRTHQIKDQVKVFQLDAQHQLDPLQDKLLSMREKEKQLLFMLDTYRFSQSARTTLREITAVKVDVQMLRRTTEKQFRTFQTAFTIKCQLILRAIDIVAHNHHRE